MSKEHTKVKALVLDTDAAGYTGSDPVHFGDFPGIWQPGRPIALSELGFNDEKDARDTVAALGLPLREVTVEAGSAPMPERDNRAPSEPAAPVEAPAAVAEPEPAAVEGDA